jgi:ABC-2 type transport system ATP-binding protein
MRRDNSVLIIEGLSKIYKQKKGCSIKALNNLNISLDGSQIIGLIGKNGAGKTTFIKACCELITYQGKITYCTKIKNKIPNKNYAAVLEGNRNIYWKLTVLENILYFASLRFKKKKEILSLTNELLKRLYLEDKKDVLVENLSKGMKQKTALICSLVLDVPVLFLDEPSIGLDIESTQQIVEFLNNKELLKDKLIVITSHILEFIKNVVHDFIIMKDGSFITQGTISNLVEKDKLIEIILKGDEHNLKFLKNRHYDIIKENQVRNDLFVVIDNKENKFISQIANEFERNQNRIIGIRKLKYDLKTIYLLAQEGKLK